MYFVCCCVFVCDCCVSFDVGCLLLVDSWSSFVDWHLCSSLICCSLFAMCKLLVVKVLLVV